MNEFIYIGTYSEPISMGNGEVYKGNGKGIYSVKFDPETGDFSSDPRCTPAENTSFLCVSDDKQYLYAVNELDRIDGKPAGKVSAYRISPDGSLTFLNEQQTGGAAPCHLSVDRKNRCLFAANYMSGSISVFPLCADGTIGIRTQLITHNGSGPDVLRQEGPHAHCVYLNQEESILYTADLGIDRVDAYSIDYTNHTLSERSGIGMDIAKGAGPRSLTGSANGKFLYITTELTCKIMVYAILDEKPFCIQEISTLPKNSVTPSTTADLTLTSDGQFLYVSNRGHNGICVFAVSKDGLLSEVQWISSEGKTPRSFVLDHSEHWLIAANQDSDCLTLYERNTATGCLCIRGKIEMPTPVCIRMCNLMIPR